MQKVPIEYAWYVIAVKCGGTEVSMFLEYF